MLMRRRGLAGSRAPRQRQPQPGTARPPPGTPPEIPLFRTPFLRTPFFGDPHFGALPQNFSFWDPRFWGAPFQSPSFPF